MNKILMTFCVLAMLLIAGCSQKTTEPLPEPQPMPPVTQEINSFEDCVAAGNAVMESYPRQCNADGQNFVEEVQQQPLPPELPQTDSTYCTDEQKAAEMCTMEYMPVCGDDGMTYGNKCAACGSKKINSYTPGECPQLIGGQKDEHGCLGPAGYSWNAEINACARVWELETEEQIRAAKVAVESYGPENGLTVTSVLAKSCTGCFEVELDKDQQRTTMILEDWKVKQELGGSCGPCPQFMPPAPNWCSDGTVVSGVTNECGCQGPPRCEVN